MTEICPKCGLPKELCVCETIAKENQKIHVKLIKKKFGKIYTIIEGIDDKDIKLKHVAKELKTILACGGTAKGGIIELQGNHRSKILDVLVKLGFSPETIELK